MPYLTRPKGHKLRLRQIEIWIYEQQHKDIKVIQDKQKGPETEYIKQQPAHTRSIQELIVLLPGQWMHNVLSTIEHHSLQNIRDD